MPGGASWKPDLVSRFFPSALWSPHPTACVFNFPPSRQVNFSVPSTSLQRTAEYPYAIQYLRQISGDSYLIVSLGAETLPWPRRRVLRYRRNHAVGWLELNAAAANDPRATHIRLSHKLSSNPRPPQASDLQSVLQPHVGFTDCLCVYYLGTVARTSSPRSTQSTRALFSLLFLSLSFGRGGFSGVSRS